MTSLVGPYTKTAEETPFTLVKLARCLQIETCHALRKTMPFEPRHRSQMFGMCPLFVIEPSPVAEEALYSSSESIASEAAFGSPSWEGEIRRSFSVNASLTSRMLLGRPMYRRNDRPTKLGRSVPGGSV